VSTATAQPARDRHPSIGADPSRIIWSSADHGHACGLGDGLPSGGDDVAEHDRVAGDDGGPADRGSGLQGAALTEDSV
jgi:hypothetical protein